MTIQECYSQFHGNYEEARDRLMNDRLIEKFMMKFPMDTTMQELREALVSEDYELAFRCAHTMKGVAANLAFTALQLSASELTEQLRNEKNAPDLVLVQKVEEDYQLVIDTLRNYEDGK